MVAASCTAKPWDRSSRSITLRVPPGFPAGMGVGVGTWVTASVFLPDFAVSDPAIPTPSVTATRAATTIPSTRLMDPSWRAMGAEKMNTLYAVPGRDGFELQYPPITKEVPHAQ